MRKQNERRGRKADPLGRRKCPRCGKMALSPVPEFNALSRRDNKTLICSECGIDEAIADYRKLSKAGEAKNDKSQRQEPKK